MSSGRDGVRIEGLAELRGKLKALESAAPKELAKELKRITVKLVPKVRARMPQRTGRAARSVRPSSSQRGAAIAVGSTRAPYAPWLDFGGSTKRWPSGAISRPFVRTGRYLFPVVEENRDEITRDAERVIADLTRRYGL